MVALNNYTKVIEVNWRNVMPWITKDYTQVRQKKAHYESLRGLICF